jgi:peptidoglycan-associated lipoprotein
VPVAKQSPVVPNERETAVSKPAPVASPQRVTETTAPRSVPAATAEAPRRPSVEETLGRLQDAFFDYDKHQLRSDAQLALRSDVELLRQALADHPATKITVEGHCDERGSAEYNLALGDQRARTAREFLAQLGVPLERLNVLSYGKEHPQCLENKEDCWQRNRRAHLTSRP